MKKEQNFLKRFLLFFILISLSLIPLIWFLGKGDILINGLDTNFPLDPLKWLSRRMFVWVNVSNAGEDFSSSTSGFFFHLIQAIPYFLGFELKMVELISLVFWFSLIVVSAWLFARSCNLKNRLAEISFVIIYAINIYLYNIWENVKVSNLALYVSLPLFLSLILNFKNKLIPFWRYVFFLLLASLVASGSGINPAYFVVLVAGIFIFLLFSVLAKKKEVKKIWFGFLVLIAVIFFSNMYWILPLSNKILFSGNIKTLSDIGLTNWLDSLSKNTSLLNVLRLQGAWDWYSVDEAGQPLYIPYALNYFRKIPFILFSFVLPILAALSLIFKDRSEKRSLYLPLTAFFVIGVVMGAGTHPPTGFIYQFMIEKIPFFSFFRSPWYIFTPFLIFAYAGLTALFFARLLNNSKGFLKVMFTFGIFGFWGAYLVYSYPLITGKIFRPGRNDGFLISFPDYVWQTKSYLDKLSSKNARLITYPEDQIESFSWGYRGTDTILSLFSNVEFITPSLNLANNRLNLLINEFYLDIKKGNLRSAIALMGALRADTIFNRKDFISLSPKLDSQVISKFTSIETKNFSEWEFIKINENSDISKIYVPESLYLNYSTDLATIAGFELIDSQKLMIVRVPDSEYSKIPIGESAGGSITEGVNVTSKLKPTANEQSYLLTVSEDGVYTLFLNKDAFASLKDDPKTAEITALVDSRLALKNKKNFFNSEYYCFEDVFLEKGEHQIKVVFPKLEENLNFTSSQSLLNHYPISLDNSLNLDGKSLVLYNESQDKKSATIDLPYFNPFGKYILSYDYRYYYGAVPTIDIVQFTESSPLKVVQYHLGDLLDWKHKEIEFVPVPFYSKAKLEITIPKSEKEKANKSVIKNIKFSSIYTQPLYAVKKPTENEKNNLKISSFKVSPTKYKVKVDGNGRPYFLVFSENYSDKWTLKSDDLKEKPVHFSANGYANAWYIPDGKANQNLTIFYEPQNLFFVGLGFLVLTGVVVVFFLIKKIDVK